MARKVSKPPASFAMILWGHEGSRQILVYDARWIQKHLKKGQDAFWEAWEDIDYGSKDDPFIGMIEVQDPAQECGDVYKVGLVIAKKGYGPLLYDLGLTFAKRDRMDGLIPDRRSVTQAAQNIWKVYKEERPDVTHKPIKGREDKCKRWPNNTLNYVYSIKNPLNTRLLLAQHKNTERMAERARVYELETLLFEEGYSRWQDFSRRG